MVKSIGIKKIKTAIFISGSGSNFLNLIKFSLKKISPIKIICVISNNGKSGSRWWMCLTNPVSDEVSKRLVQTPI